jgi:hypothetical protein
VLVDDVIILLALIDDAPAYLRWGRQGGGLPRLEKKLTKWERAALSPPINSISVLTRKKSPSYMANPHLQEFHPILPAQPASMDTLALRFLVCFSKALSLRRRYPEAFSSQSESAQPPVSLDSLIGKKARKARKKERMAQEQLLPLSMLSCAMKRRMSEVYAQFFRAKISKDSVCRFSLYFSFYTITFIRFVDLL